MTKTLPNNKNESSHFWYFSKQNHAAGVGYIPVNIISDCFNVGQRRRRWTNRKTTLGQRTCHMFAGLNLHDQGQ